MFYNKYPYASNFEFIKNIRLAKGRGNSLRAAATVGDFDAANASKGTLDIDIGIKAYQGDIYRLEFSSRRWARNYSQSELSYPEERKTPGATRLDVDRNFNLSLRSAAGGVILESMGGYGFGVCGDQSCFIFNHRSDDRFYGMGEKLLGLELSDKISKFWNTDVMGDFHPGVYENNRPDPSYASIPYLIIRRKGDYIGLLLDNPFATFIATGSKVGMAGTISSKQAQEKRIILGAEHGQPNIIIIYGPTLAELTCKLQKLVGTTPLPPVWALGYNQCRWGYRSESDLMTLHRNFLRHNIPCDGLWLDIDYMNGFRVFTINKKHFPNVKKTLKTLLSSQRRVIPILDPGVKAEPRNPVYQSGKKAGIFCLNPQGKEYVGLVWPGETVFPDYSTPAGQKWWSAQVRKFAQNGIHGAWIDMNDPSTGQVSSLTMRFNSGRDSHYTYHNQYALGMAKSTRMGFNEAHPNLRTFVLSRSAFTGSSKWTALWTGDNVSNEHYLKMTIPTTLNLALSGIPFNGPDIGGFGGDTNPHLFSQWIKSGFLFPFCRNHTAAGTVPQEPWAMGKETLRVARHYIQLRYKLRPYLYNLFIQQEETGQAIARPLFYDFDDNGRFPISKIEDEFMIGPFILQAPILSQNAASRKVILPGKTAWYSALDGRWINSGQVDARCTAISTPIYLPHGAVIPASMEKEGSNAYDGRKVEFHIFLRKGTGKTEYDYAFDDGVTLDYKKGMRTRIHLTARARGNSLQISIKHLQSGFGKCIPTFVLYDNFREVVIIQDGGEPRRIKPKAASWILAGTRQKIWRCD